MEEKPDVDEEDRFTLAIFPVKQYLSDAALQKAVVGITDGRDFTLADAQALTSFHPLGGEVLKQKVDNDVYGLLGIYGKLVRTHIVMANGFAQTNPPPNGYICDSCHTKGWLKKDFQDSKIDGANVAVWLCMACSKLVPEQRDVRF